MFVCRVCHEKDVNVTKCQEVYSTHSVEVWGDCDICCEDNIGTVWCLEYDKCDEVPYEGDD